MAMDELLPAACAFAVSVLAERDLDPDSVPEEAIEAAEYHIATCVRCLSSTSVGTPARKKKKVRRAAEPDYLAQGSTQTLIDEPVPSPQMQASPLPVQTPPPAVTPVPVSSSSLPALINGPLDCQRCRLVLQEYAEAMDSGQNVATLYPEVHDHLLSCETGCLVLLDLFRQEAKANRKYRRRPIRDPFSAIGWELTGFFRGGQVPISPVALSYGTLLLLLLVATFSVYFSIRWDDARYYHAPLIRHSIPTPDGVGLSDGLKIYDACNANGYQYKREAAQAMQHGDFTKADSLLTSATNASMTDTTGCNGAEAAIYREDLQIRQSGHPFAMIVVSFDSGPGNADPQGGTDRHVLYAAYTQELVGAYIAQQQYNSTQIQTPGAPLLYLVLANTTGVEQGALQIANSIASMVTATKLQQFGLQISGPHPLLAVLGLGPSSLAQVVLPVLCRAGVPLIVPTATGGFIVDLLSQTSLYRHCTPGFAFVRFSPDDASQSTLAADYAYYRLYATNVAIFYDPSNPSSTGSAQAFRDAFTRHRRTRIVALETAVASGLLDANGRPQASRDDLLAGLNDALQAKIHPDLIYAPLLTNDVITLAQTIASLPQDKQPILMIGGEFVQPVALQGLVQWARQQQLTLPHIFVSASSAARPPTNGAWQKQFYARFCTSFATPGSYCSGAAALDQGALLFGDGVEIVVNGIGPLSDASKLPTTAQLVQSISAEKFAGISCPISLHLWNNVLVTSTRVLPVILGIQQDGSIQIVG